MSRTKIKTGKVSGFRIAVMIILMFLLSLIMSVSVIMGISLLKSSSGPINGLSNDATTVRKQTPTDGTLPTESSAIDNIGYMAYVLDSQPYYHTYANNKTKSSGVTQTTQSWKDYKSKSVSGEGHSVMISSDLSYGIVKSATQACFIASETQDAKALIRGGSKPSSTGTTALDIDWSTTRPTIYDEAGYKKVYGEFSTEISVYVINADTLENWTEVIDNGDGTYTQTYYLNSLAGFWYQYGMKTRGSLKNFPVFKKIEISFTFDGNWRILKSECNETATISPKAMGGMDIRSDSYTLTIYDYSEDGPLNSAEYHELRGRDGDFDCVSHYAYYEDFFKQYKDYEPSEGETSSNTKIDVISVLGGGFGKVITDGQQFNISSIKLGDTEYDGKIFLKLKTENILGTIDARVTLSKKGSNKQDLYIEFKGSVDETTGETQDDINVYYSTDFALTANIGEVTEAVDGLSKLIKQKTAKPPETTPVRHSLADDEATADGSEGGGLSLDALLDAIKLDVTDSEVVLKLQSDDLLGLGIGIDAVLSFYRVGDDGDMFSVKSVNLNSIKYDNKSISLSAEITPDDGNTVIEHNPAQAPANLADYINSVYNVLNSNTIKVDLGLNGNLVEGLDLLATAYVAIGSEIAASLEITASLNDVSVHLYASYIYGYTAYGKAYLWIDTVNGKTVNAKVFCDIGDTKSAIEDIIGIFNGDGEGEGVQAYAADGEGTDGTVGTLVTIINKVLNLNFGRIIGSVSANEEEISLSINIDELLSELGISVDELIKNSGVSLGDNFGTLTLTLNSKNSTFSGGLSGIGLYLGIEGSDNEFSLDNAEDYFDIELLVQYAKEVILKGLEIADSHDIEFSLTASATEDNFSVEGNGEVVWGDDSVQVAVSLTVKVDEEQDIVIEFVYDDSAAEEEPLALLTLSDKTHTIGTKIARDEFSNFLSSFEDLIALFKDGGAETYSAGGRLVAPTAATGYGLSVGGVSVSELLASDAVSTVLKTVFDFITEFTVQINLNDEKTAVYDILVKYAEDLEIKVNANDGLNLSLAYTDEYALSASVAAGEDGATVISEKRGAILADSDNFVYFTEFVHALYENIFGYKLDSKLLNKLFGETYSIRLHLSGANSDISAIENIDILATLYYGEGIVGDELGTKLLRVDLNLNIGGTEVLAGVAYAGNNIYIELKQINETLFDDIRFSASVYALGDAVEELVSFITDTDLVETISGLLGKSAPANYSASVSVLSEGEEGNPAKSTLTKVLEAILGITFKTYTPAEDEEVDYTKKYLINLDSVAEAFLGVKVGNIEAKYNSNTKVLTADAALEESEPWLTLYAGATDVEKVEIDTSAYTDISFLSTLISDLKKTVTDKNGNITTLYTFSGSISVDLAKVLTIELNNVKLSAGLDNGKFYVSMTADTNGKLISSSGLGNIIMNNSTVSLTYVDGLIVLGRDVNNGSKAVYKVVTLAYLLDNLFTGDTIIKWYMGIEDWVWGLIKNNVSNININNGLPKPGEYYLYDTNSGAEEGEGEGGEEGDDSFNLNKLISQYMLGILVNIDGDNAYSFGTDKDKQDVINQFNLSSNYYALNVNSASLIGDMIPKLYAALLRGNDGLSGLKAYGEISTFATFNVNLTNITKNDNTTPVDNYLTHVIENYKFNPNKYEDSVKSGHKSVIFGSYTTDGWQKESTAYSPSYVLDTVTLEVYDANRNLDRKIDMVYGSTVYLIAPDVDINIDEAHRFAYVDSHGVNLGNVMVVQDEAASVANVAIDADNAARIYASSVTTDEVELIYIGVKNEEIVGELGPRGTTTGWVGDPIVMPDGVSFEGYSFAGWFKDENLTVPLKSILSKVPAYGKFVETVVKKENGVIYSFDSRAMGYGVTGRDESIISEYYYGNGSKAEYPWLIIESHINGVEVKFIGGSAFESSASNDNGRLSDSLVNVLVPETVKAVYHKAFRDNKGLQNVVFLGEDIFFGGRTNSGSKNSIFYGSYLDSDISNNVSTKLKVYLNYRDYENNKCYDPYGIEDTDIKDDASTDKEWYRLHYNRTYYANVKDYNPNDVNPEKDWTFAEYVFDFSAIDLNTYSYLKNISVFSYGVDSVVRTKSEIADEAVKQINIKTAENHNFIDGFEVSVSEDTALGKYTKVVITVTEAPIKSYRVNYNLDGNAYIEGLIEKDYLTGYFATEGVTYYIVPKDGYAITSVSGVNATEVENSEDGRYSFEMSTGLTEINIATKAFFTEITLNSDIEFTMDGVDGSVKTVTVEAEAGDAMVAGATAQNSNFVFVGWAHYDGTKYVLEGDTINYSVYYAIWAYQRDGISLSVNGTTLSATVDGSKANSVYGWYAATLEEGEVVTDFADGNLIDKCSDNSITVTATSSTILSARMVFNFNYTMTTTQSVGLINPYTIYVGDNDEEQKYDKNGGSFNILEGTEFKVSWYDFKKVLLVGHYDEDGYKTKYFRFKYRSGLSTTTQYEVVEGSFNNDDVTAGTTITVSENITLNIKDSKNEP